MPSENFTPWWEHVNDFDTAEDQRLFVDSVRRYIGPNWMRPNYNRQAQMLGAVAGYRGRKFAQPESYTGKKKQ
ncbi:hypothetical protein UFOVP46_20 [uncultured Caudovirales phage]|uniref:Uncharacterized protein n=1 Tax=uncultured Caudovirales phage TaxID=2100421 RepID=A0A6J5KRJ9_9CAUD|nr:hypothetical protein UFOVP46_20 [uncultured Caudovirales phage]